MSVRVVGSTPSAYQYPLLIKQLLLTPLAIAPEREITYQGRVRFNYRTLKDRIGRLANLLAGLDVRPGRTVAMMDWDSHRYGLLLHVRFVKTLAKTSIGKMNKRLIRADPEALCL